MKKLFLFVSVLFLALTAQATVSLTKSTPLTLTAASEGFSQSTNAKALVDGEWINWPDGTIQDGFAKWRVNIVNDGIYTISLDMTCDNGFMFRTVLLNPTTGDTIAVGRSDYASNKTNTALDGGSFNLIGLETGEYDIAVTDTIIWSHGKLRGVTLTYQGGSTITIPANSLAGPDAVLGKTGSKYMVRTAEGYLKSNDNSDPTSEYAYWHIRATKGGQMKVTATVEAPAEGDPTIHQYCVILYSDLNTAAIDTAQETAKTSTTGEKVLTSLDIPEAGDYYIKLVNKTQWSSAILSSISFEYTGGEKIAIPATLTPSDVLLSPRAWVDKTGAVDSILFTPRGSEGYNLDEWAKWKVKVTTAGYYNFTAYTYRASSQKFEIAVLNSAENDTIILNDNGGNSIGSGDKTISSGKVELTPGIYVIRVRNIYKDAPSRLLKVEAAYEGGKTIDIPATLNPEDAILSNRAWVDKTGTVDSILFTPRGSEGYNSEEWAKWRINVTQRSVYNFTAHVYRPSGSQKYEIKVLNSDESVEKISNTNNSMDSGAQTISSGRVELTPGIYFIKIRNIYKDAPSRLLKVVATYEGGVLLDVPATTSLLPVDAMLSDSAGVVSGTPDVIDFKVKGSHKYNACEWAKWRINVTEKCSYIFTANVTSTIGQYYTLSVLNSSESETIGEKIRDTDMSSGDKALATDPIVLPVGEYVVKIVNPYPYSDGCVKSISIVQATPVTISEDAIDLDDITGAATVDAQLTRTFYAGMYNTICLPFAVSAAEMNRVFPSAVVKELTSSSIEEGDFVLNLNFDDVSEMAAGTPYLIRPAADVSNPKFIGITIDKTLNPTNTSRANFVGNFVAGTITASENNLFLGANNTLYFPTQDIEILGMRGYFLIHDAPAGMIKRARIVENNQVATDIELVRPDEAAKLGGSRKLIENGQLIIIRDGIRYNAQGQLIRK